MPTSLGQSGRWKPQGSRGTPPAGNGPGGRRAGPLAPLLGRGHWLRKESAAVRAHARRSSRAALFLRYLRLHSPPPPRPPASRHTALAETPPSSPRRVERVTSRASLPTVSFSHDWPSARRAPAYRESWLARWEGGWRGERLIKESSPPTRPSERKSRGASLGACHLPACKAFLKG